MINIKKLLPIIIICLFTLQCEQGWLENIIDPTIEGCNISTACNYNPDVTKFDDSCEYISCLDCLGYPHGAAVLDSCSTCDAAPLNDCTQDCAGTWGGMAVADSCGNCSTSNIACELDCNGVWGGSAVVDTCGICEGNNLPCVECDAGLTLGCDGICSATPAVNDVCDICGGNGSTCKDCAGTVNGTATTDNCGVCDTDSSNDCSQDCNGDWGGSAVLDNCGICGGDGSDCTDCLGVVGGNATTDCVGECNGSAITDNCGVCDTDTSNDCSQDCAGTWGGTEPDTDSDGICDNLQGTVSDIDVNTYETIKIGEQWWMAENLKTTKYKDGSDATYTVYDNADIYGNLYNWFAVDHDRGLCMEGWHVPTDEEFMELEMYLGMTENEAYNTGYRGTNEGSKLAGKIGLWIGGNLVENSEFGSSGFNGIPTGYATGGGNYGEGNELLGGTANAYFWSSTEQNNNRSSIRRLDYPSSRVYRGHLSNIGTYLPIRCLRD